MNNVRRIVFLLYSLLLGAMMLFPNLGIAQRLQVQELNANNGLSQGMIFSILQTQDDFMWFGTKDGLNRYDGYNFKVYRNDLNAPYSISGNIITYLFEDSKGRFWIATQNNGLNLFDPKTERFYHYRRPTGKNQAEQHDWIVLISEDLEGNLWLGAQSKGVYKLSLNLPEDLNDADLTPFIATQFYAIPQDNFVNKIKFIHTNEDNSLWIGSQSGLFLLRNTISELNIPDLPETTLGFASIEKLSNQQYLLTTNDALILWDGKDKTSVFPLEGNGKDVFGKGVKLLDRKGRIWITENEKDILVLNSEDIQKGIYQPRKIHSFEKGVVNRMYEDKTGNIWIGSSGYGLQKYNPRQEHFNVQEKGKSAMRIYMDNQHRIWHFHNYASSRYEVLGEVSKTFKNSYESLKRNQTIESVYQMKNGDYWFLSPDRSADAKANIIHCDSDLNILAEFSEDYYLDDAHFFITKDERYILFGIEHQKLGCFDIREKTFQTFNYAEQINSADKTFNIHSFYEDGQGMIWLSTSVGLISFDFKETKYKYYQRGLGKYAMQSNSILSVMDDPISPNQYLWVGTKNGLHKLDKNKGDFEVYTTKDGLPNNTIYGILPHDNQLWLSTNHGLSCFDIESNSFNNYYKSDGLQDNEFNTRAFYKGKNGALVFGGINGLNYFFPDSLNAKYDTSETYITQLKINNISIGKGDDSNILENPIHLTETIELEHEQNLVSLGFSALDYTNPQKKQYKYMLEGADKTWIISNDNQVNYTLNPGNYTFKLFGKNANGDWQEKPTELNIVIFPPWWLSKVAYLIYFLSFLGIVFAVFKMMTNRWKLRNKLAFEQNEAKRLQELDRTKTQFFSNITHEFRTPLTLIIEPIRQLIREGGESSKIRQLKLVEKNSVHLLNLVNQLLDLAKLEDKKMQLELHRGNVLEVIHPIIKSFEPLAVKKGIELRVNAPLKTEISNFDKDKIEKILYNLISNAIKYTPEKGQVDIYILQKEEHLEIQIQDNGIGIPQALQEQIFLRFYQIDGTRTRKHEGTGIGLALTKELVEIMGGGILLESEEGKGSIFTVTIPLLKDTVFKNGNIMILENMSKVDAVSDESTVAEISLDAENIILLVEDNEELRGFIKESIGADYKIIEAKNGKEGIDLALEFLPNLIISDVMMPEKDGFELCELLKTDERTSHIPIIILTAKTAIENKIKGLKFGADDYMPKPFNTEELQTRIANLIEVRKKIRKKYQEGNIKEEEKAYSDFDQIFLNRIRGILEKNLDNENFGVNELSLKLKLSRSQLHRKLKALTNQSVGEYLRNFKLEKAYQYLHENKYSVREVMELVGFKHQGYFSKVFKEKYGMSPKEVFFVS